MQTPPFTTSACVYCDSNNMETNEQSQPYCMDCGRVNQKMAIDATVTFANCKMDGHVVDVYEKDNKTTVQKRFKRARAQMEQLARLLEVEMEYDSALEAGMRIIDYANKNDFFDKGKNIELYAAAAYYITLRFKKAPYLLIDISDKMENTGLFKLARCFLKLLRFLGFQNQLALLDPSIFIHRYCKILNLQEKTEDIILTAVKLLQRMKRDWMCQGRRPSSLCGTAILIATKFHDVNRSTNDICKTVFVCDQTIRRRLEEFKKTSIAKLTKEQFERMDDQIDYLGDEMDPPSFQKARLKSKEMQYQKQIEEKIAALPRRDKMEKIPWDAIKNSLDIPEQYLNKQIKGIEKRLEQARELYEQDSPFEDQLSCNTEQLNFGESSEEEQAQKECMEQEINEEQIEKFILTEQESEQKKLIWTKHNAPWLEKQKVKEQRSEKVKKRKLPNKNEKSKGADLLKSKMGNNINKEQYNLLLASEPQVPSKKQSPSLEDMFNPFAYKWQPKE